jgi:hypothetical protein
LRRKSESTNGVKRKRTGNETRNKTGIDGTKMSTRDNWSNASMSEGNTKKTEEATMVTNNVVMRGSLISLLESSKLYLGLCVYLSVGSL